MKMPISERAAAAWALPDAHLLLSRLELLTDAGYLVLARPKLLGRLQIVADHFVLHGLKTLGKLCIVLSHLLLRLLEMISEVCIVTGQLCLAGFELLDSLLQVREFAGHRLAPLRQLGRDRSGCWTSGATRPYFRASWPVLQKFCRTNPIRGKPPVPA
jgi:hypothetical protein